MMKHHPFHIVNISPWPLISSINALSLTLSIIMMILFKSTFFLFSMLLTLTSSILWWRDIYRESHLQGSHTPTVMSGLKTGMILFIVSEILFFLSFFWTYFHASLSPNVELGCCWPPLLIETLNPTQIPLLNTIVLLYSGASITWCHHSVLNSWKKKANKTLFLTIFLGIWFTFLQLMEYSDTAFSTNNSTYGSIFFIATGFHGLHVLLGSTFLLVNFIKLTKNYFSEHHHVGFEMATWYWHFVDVVWLFLYISIYWWGK